MAGACAGVLLAATNLYITVALQDRIAAALAAGGDEFFRRPVLRAFWLGLVLLGAMLTLIAVRGVWRGSPSARAGLLVLSGLVVLSAFIGFCLGMPGLSLLDVSGQELLGFILLELWISLQLFAFTMGVTVIALLQAPGSREYFRPRFLPDPAVVKV